MFSDRWELPTTIDHLMRLIALKYQKEGNDFLRKVIVNASYAVIECVTYDNWNGGTAEHDIKLILPESLYFEILDKKANVEGTISNDLNSFSNVENESIRTVHIDIHQVDDGEWKQSHDDVLFRKIKNVSAISIKHIWGDSGVRLFLSHKDKYKKKTEALKEELKAYGISAFVAHTSIKPTKEWLKEIENALLTMDAFAALMCDDFCNSEWTDQEVGYASCRGVPVLSICLAGQDPHGFMRKDQKMVGSWDNIKQMAADIFSVFAETPALSERLKDAAIEAFINAPSFLESIHFVQEILPAIKTLTEEQIKKIQIGFENNDQIHGCFVVGKHLGYRLSEAAGRKFVIEEGKLIEVAKETGIRL